MRQVSSLRAYLFTLVMEIFSQLFNRGVNNNLIIHSRRYHKLYVSHIIYADDVLIFADSSVRNALAINQNEFHSWAGLGTYKAKCSLSFSATSVRVKRKIIRTLGFREVQLPLQYWGLPLVSTRLRHSDCLLLLDKFNRRISNWKGRLLSYAGRMELISSVLASLHIYGSSAFRLPDKILKSMSIRDFFWSGPEPTYKIHTINWSNVDRRMKVDWV